MPRNPGLSDGIPLGFKVERARRIVDAARQKGTRDAMKLITALHKAIEDATGERAVHRELELRPWIIAELFGKGWFVVSRFSLGNEHEADFVVLHGFSGGWDIHSWS